MKEILSEYPVIVELPVAWGEMDSFQHVNNVVYFKYFEMGRISYFTRIDFLGHMDRTGVGPIMSSTQCRYKIPLIYPDVVSIGTKVEDITENQFTMKYAVVSHKYKKMAAFGECQILAFNYQKNIKTTIPEDIKQKIIDLENTTC